MRRHTIRRMLMAGGTAAIGAVTALSSVAVATPQASAASSSGGGGAPIVVGGVAQVADYAGLADGFNARITKFNKAGGIDGRKIQFLGVNDDGGSPATDLTAVQKLVQANHVDVVAPLISEVFTPAGATFLQQNKTPYIGWSVAPVWCGSDYGYSIDGCLIPSNGSVSLATGNGLAKFLGGPKKAKGKTVAIVNNDIPTATASGDTELHLFQSTGYKVVFNKGIIPINGTATNYAPYVEQILASKPDIVFLSLDFASSIGLSAGLLEAGYKGIVYSPVDYSEGILQSQPSVKQALQHQVVYTELPAAEDKSPAVKQVQAALKAIGKGGEPVSLGVTLGYYDADMLIQLLQNAKAKGQPLTGAGIASAAGGGFQYKQTAKGGACSQSFPAANQAGIVGSTVLQVEGAQYKLKVPYTCYPNVKPKAS